MNYFPDNTDKIEYNSFGCVSYCDGCSEIKVGFGNIFFNFSRKDFTEFSNFISRINQDNRDEMIQRGHNLFINTQTNGMMIMMNLKELEKLNDLLQKAEIQITVKEILEIKN
jgi:transcriptional/translational regulatory protein YebC/TACO1